MKLNIVCPIIGSSGYAAHGRQLARSLHDAGCTVRLDTQIPPGYERTLNDAEVKMVLEPFTEDMTTIFIGQPQFWRLALADNPKHFIGFVVWEGDQIPKYWLPYLLDERVDQVWCPSQHVLDAIFFSVLGDNDKYDSMTRKIRVVPHGVSTELFFPKLKDSGKPFTFICNKGWSGTSWDRGGLQYAMRAFKEEFREDENVRMLVKVNPAYFPVPMEYHAQWFSERMAELNLPVGAPMHIDIQQLEYSTLVDGLYREGDVLVNPTRCEGFGLPGLEAHACGLPTISTDYGGQTDYMTSYSDMHINYNLELVTQDLQYEGISWAVPDIACLCRQMRWCFDHPELVAEMGQLAAKDTKNWTWDSTAKKAISFLKEL